MIFPKPWRVEFCGDCYRVYDAKNRQLFVISGDEFGGDENEDPAKATVFTYGEAEEQDALSAEIERMFMRGRAMETWFKGIQLNKAELSFFAEVETACLGLEVESLERDELLEMINIIGAEKGQPQAMRDKVMAFYDELALRRAVPTNRQ